MAGLLPLHACIWKVPQKFHYCSYITQTLLLHVAKLASFLLAVLNNEYNIANRLLTSSLIYVMEI